MLNSASISCHSEGLTTLISGMYSSQVLLPHSDLDTTFSHSSFPAPSSNSLKLPRHHNLGSAMVSLGSTAWIPPSFARRDACWLTAGPLLSLPLSQRELAECPRASSIQYWRGGKWPCTSPSIQKGYSGSRSLLESAPASAPALVTLQ